MGKSVPLMTRKRSDFLFFWNLHEFRRTLGGVYDAGRKHLRWQKAVNPLSKRGVRFCWNSRMSCGTQVLVEVQLRLVQNVGLDFANYP